MKSQEILYALVLIGVAGYLLYSATRKKQQPQTEDWTLGGFPSGIDIGQEGGGFGGGGGSGF